MPVTSIDPLKQEAVQCYTSIDCAILSYTNLNKEVHYQSEKVNQNRLQKRFRGKKDINKDEKKVFQTIILYPLSHKSLRRFL